MTTGEALCTLVKNTLSLIKNLDKEVMIENREYIDNIMASAQSLSEKL